MGHKRGSRQLLADTKRGLVGHINIHHHEDNRLVPMADRYLDDKHSCNRFYIRDNDREVLKHPSLGSMWIKLRIGLAENGVYLPNPSAMVL